MERETYIDGLTGELVEKEDQNEIIKRKLYEDGVITQESYNLILQKRMIDEKYEMFRQALLGGMKNNGFTNWTNELFTCSITKEGIKVVFDNKRAKETTLYEFLLYLSNADDEMLKNTSVYDCFKKVTYSKESLRINFKEGV